MKEEYEKKQEIMAKLTTEHNKRFTLFENEAKKKYDLLKKLQEEKAFKKKYEKPITDLNNKLQKYTDAL